MNQEIMSPQVNEIFAALSKAQAEMKVAAKDSTNPYHKSKYADIQSVFEAIRQPLANNQLCITQMPGESGENAVLITILGHQSGQWLLSRTPIKLKILKKSKDGSVTEENMNAQELTAAITYARRTAAAAITGCYAGEKDNDGNDLIPESDGHNNVDTTTGEIQNKEVRYISEKQQKMLFAKTVDAVGYRDNLIKKYGSLSTIPATDMQSILDHLIEWQSNPKNNAKVEPKKQTEQKGTYYEDCPF